MPHGAWRRLLSTAVWAGLCAGCITPQASDSSSLAAAPNGATPTNAAVANAYPEQQSSFESTVPRPGSALDNPELLADEPDEEPSWVERLENYSFKNSWRRTLEVMGLGPDEAEARAAFQEGETLFRQENYDAAAAKFKKAARKWPDSVLQEDALFMQAEAYFFADRYGKASDVYTNLMKKYEFSRHMDKIMLRRFAIARYWDKMGLDRGMLEFNLTNETLPFWDTQGNTIALYDSIRLDDPTGPLSDDATMATANLYFLRGQYEDAAYHYDLVRKHYPQSEHQPEAHFLGVESHQRAYQGPHYDGKPLDEADKILGQVETQFYDELPDKRQQINDARRRIEGQKAERDWQMGEYYAKNRHYGAARFYYNQVIQEFPTSPFADMCRQRLEEYKAKPDNPVNRFEWLVAPFAKD